MIPRNEPVLQLQASVRERSWVQRVQTKLESFCEAEAVRNPNQLVQETSAYLEKQMMTAGTNMRKFCAEFMKELLLPDSADEVEATQADTLNRESNGSPTGTRKAMQTAKPLKLIDDLAFDPQGSVSDSSIEDPKVDHISAGTIQQEEQATHQAVPLVEVVDQFVQRGVPEGDADQYAHWFVSEEYRKSRLAKSTSASSLQSSECLQREASGDSLLDWEVI